MFVLVFLASHKNAAEALMHSYGVLNYISQRTSIVALLSLSYALVS